MLSQSRIGIVGGGVYGLQMLKCFAAQQTKGRVALAGLADLSPDILKDRKKRFRIKGYADYHEMFDDADLDAVAVATPDHLHAEIILAAAERGLHVISQKPLDVDASSAESLIERCDSAGVLLYVDFHKRFDPAHIRLREDIAKGLYGRLQYGSVHMEDRIVVPTEWLRRWAVDSNPSWFLGVHYYDLVYFLTGQEPRRVLAAGHKGKLERMGLNGAWDSVQARVEYAGGLTMNYDLSWILPESFPSIVNQGIRLVGEEGIVEVDAQDRGYFSATSVDPACAVINTYGALEYDHPALGPLVDGYTFTSMEYFVDLLHALARGSSLSDLKGKYPDGREALVSTRIGVAVDRSMASGRIEEIPHD